MQYCASLTVLIVGVLMSADNPQPAVKVKLEPALDVQQEKLVRDSVYHGKLVVSRLDRDGLIWDILAMPQPLIDLYQKQPRAVLELLLKIMEGGSPKDSVLAAGYALSLIDGPPGSGGVVCLEHFDKDTYDTPHKHWETTPRQHWIRTVRGHMNKKQAPAP